MMWRRTRFRRTKLVKTVGHKHLDELMKFSINTRSISKDIFLVQSSINHRKNFDGTEKGWTEHFPGRNICHLNENNFGGQNMENKIRNSISTKENIPRVLRFGALNEFFIYPSQLHTNFSCSKRTEQCKFLAAVCLLFTKTNIWRYRRCMRNVKNSFDNCPGVFIVFL